MDPRRVRLLYSRLFRSGCVRGDSAVDQLTEARSADDLPLAGDGLASADCHHGPSFDLETFPGGVVGAVVKVHLPDRPLMVRIPERQICIEPDPYRALPWV